MLAKRPPGMDPETWRKERDEVWKRRNRAITILMVIAIGALLVRYFFAS